MANLSSLSAGVTAATALSNLILASPQDTQGYQPQNKPNADGSPSTAQQPPSFLFHYEGEQSVSLQSDITDHYIEDNTAIQDQIALKPEKVTTHGYIGELNDIAPKALKLFQTAANKLTVISAYTPVLSATALLAYNQAFQLYQVGQNATNAAVSAWSSINSTGGENVIGANGLDNGVFNAATGQISNNQNKQQVAFQQFYGYWRARTLFTVQTPWAIFKNMAIESLRAVQSEETSVISDFEVSFKMIRTAKTALSSDATQEIRAAQQAAGVTDQGTSSPKPSIGVSDGLARIGAQ